MGTVPLAAIEVPAGRHFVAVTQRGYVPYTRDVELARGATLVIDTDLHRTHQRTAAYVVLGVDGALVIASGVAALLAHSSDSDASSLHAKLAIGGQDPSVITDYNNALADRRERLHASEWLGGAAGAVLATSALLYCWFDNRAAGSAARNQPQR